MKRLLSIIVFCAAAASASAQEENPAELRDLRLFEWEFGYGLNFGPRWDNVKAQIPGSNLILETRLNRPEPWDFGLQLKMAHFVHDIPDISRITSVLVRPTLFFDYNLRAPDISLFVGVGVGGSFATNNGGVRLSPNGGVVFKTHSSSLALTPRVGISLFRGFRITAEYTLTERDYRCFNLNFGAVIGSSYKPNSDERMEKMRRRNRGRAFSY